MTTQPLLADIERFLDQHAMRPSTFGRKALNDWKFVKSLRTGRRCWLEVEDRVRRFMVTFDAANSEGVSSPPAAVAPNSSAVVCDRQQISQSGAGL